MVYGNRCGNEIIRSNNEAANRYIIWELNGMDRNRESIETMLFFLVAYGICWGIGILNYYDEFMSGYTMALFMMTLPATGVSVAKLYRNVRSDENRRIHLVYAGCFAGFVFLMFLRIGGIISEAFLEMVTNYILLPIVSVLLFIFALLNGGALSVGRNWKEVRRELLIFMISLIVGGIISGIGTSNIDFLFIATLPVSYVFFFLQGAAFFGEEYGWRGFLQEKMQRRFGKRAGVVLLGVIWEIWHMPIWFSVYRVDGLGLVLRLFSTVSFAIIIGYAYMKSNNVWVCAFMHYSINLFATVFPGNANSYDLNAGHITWARIAEVLLLFIVFSSFLCTKIYRK